ncbi:MAG: divalent-cation tolerance protein CutA [Gammaproteobacteria bacterium]|nr:divalent-cation tolerance protein CutA [Gammaproteobacteria bacterium]
MSDSAVMIMTTVDSESQADTVCRALIEQNLAACIQELPVSSRYRWQGEIQRDREILLLVKTAADVAGAAMQAIERLHDYEVPEILAVPVTAGLPAYLQWLVTETRTGGDGLTDSSTPPGKS